LLLLSAVVTMHFRPDRRSLEAIHYRLQWVRAFSEIA